MNANKRLKNIRIEKASVSDAHEILSVQKAAFLGQAKIYNNFKLPPLTQTYESIKEEFEEKTFLKAMLRDQIVASVRSNSKYGTVTIDRLIVLPKHQNYGVGCRLLKEVEVGALNAKAFQLFTGIKSVRNIHVYKKLGYKIVSKEITEQGIELLRMLKLAQSPALLTPHLDR